METVGVRELRQNASKLLARVADGETFVITSRGQEVARLVPGVQQPTTRRDLISRGLLIPGRGDLLDVKGVQAPPGTPSTSQLLDELREDR